MIDGYLAEWEQEAPKTRTILAAAPTSKFDWRPHEKGKSLAELCGHIALAPMGITQVLDADRFDVADRPPPEPVPKSTEEVLALHDEGAVKTVQWLQALGPRANDPWRLVKGDTELMALPRGAAVRFFLFNHLVHHRGQLSAYLRIAGEKVPAIYGPSADEDPFG